MSDDVINYEELAQEAMRGVVRRVLTIVAELGELPGDHHFFIAFDTHAEGLQISKRLQLQYPEDMTIILQHQFSDLNVYDDYFEVVLSFNGVAEKLVVPYKAIKVFYDPSSQYGLHFGPPEGEKLNDQSDEIKSDLLEDNEEQYSSAVPEFTMSKTVSREQGNDAEKAETKEENDDNKSADIVSLDTFRKK